MRTSNALLLAAVVGSVLGLTGAGVASAEPVKPDVYVALGDSFSAGSGIAPQASSQVCGRSAVNYPSLLAEQLQIPTVRDVTCGSAETENFAGPQFTRGGTAGPQYDALSEDTDLVTVGIGGNDIELVQLAVGCIDPLPVQVAPGCSDRPDVAGDRIAAFGSTYDTVLDEIARRSPDAEIVMVGYPTGIRPGGCPSTQPIRPADATYLQSKIDQLNTVMADAAARHGATYVDLATSTRDHDVCAQDSWMVGIIPTSPDAYVPLHPTAAGHANAAQQVLAAL